MLLGGKSNCQGCQCQPSPICFDGITPLSDYDYFDNAQFLAGGISIGSSSKTLSSVTIYNGGSSSSSGIYCTVWPNDTTDTSLPYGPRPKKRSLTPPYDFPSECIALTPPGSFSGATWTFTHSAITLSANTIYWIVLSGQMVVPGTSSGNGGGGWDFDEFGGYGGIASETCYFLSNYSQSAAQTWQDNYATNRYLFDWS